MLPTPWILILALTGLIVAPASAATPPALACQSGKNKAAGKYAYCRQKAEAKYATARDGTLRTAALQKCLDEYDLTWPLLESSAAAAGGGCPSTGDQSAIRGVIDTQMTNVTMALGGGTLQTDLVACQDNLAACNADLATCLSGPPRFPATGQTTCWDGTGVAIPCAGTGQDGDTRTGETLSYSDNGDGTITDNVLGLMWEKLSDDGSIHDKDKAYTWDQAIALKVATLNSQRFAGYTDWRLPNVRELESIVDYEVSSGPTVSPAFQTSCVPGCTVGMTCSCTAPGKYWSSSTGPGSGNTAWTVGFDDGRVDDEAKSYYTTTIYGIRARAVRGGS